MDMIRPMLFRIGSWRRGLTNLICLSSGKFYFFYKQTFPTLYFRLQEVDASTEAYLINDGSKEAKWSAALEDCLLKKAAKYTKV